MHHNPIRLFRLKTTLVLRATAVAIFWFGVVALAVSSGLFHWRDILSALNKLGTGGFALFCAYTVGVLGLLGASWYVIVPSAQINQLGGFVFARIMREVAADILPFSQAGGFLVGVRGACLFGVSPPISIASSIVDLGNEMVGQLLFTAIGLSVLSLNPPPRFPHKVLDLALAIGIGLGGLTATGFIVAQRLALSGLTRISEKWAPSLRIQISAVRQNLVDIYKRPERIILAVIIHLSAWLVAVCGVWLMLVVMGADLPLPAVLALESLIYLLRSVAFFVRKHPP